MPALALLPSPVTVAVLLSPMAAPAMLLLPVTVAVLLLPLLALAVLLSPVTVAVLLSPSVGMPCCCRRDECLVVVAGGRGGATGALGDRDRALPVRGRGRGRVVSLVRAAARAAVPSAPVSHRLP